MKSPTVLVVDDEPDLLSLIELTLTKLGLQVVAMPSVSAAKIALDQRKYDLCLTDMRLKDGTGLDVLAAIASRQLDLPTAVITAHGNTENAIAALKAGAFDYLAKPVSIDQLRALVRSALAVPKAPATLTDASKPNEQRNGTLRNLLGSAPPIERLRELLQRLSQTLAPVHIHGESGTGKELAARLLHDKGPRRDGPFVAVNCGAIPENLMEAEFFGSKKGAFTGAHEDRIGFFQAAHGGTLFLDEVADLPLSMQVKLLRAIQERSVRRVGSTLEEPVDVRILSATHKNLSTLVSNNVFRQDLFYRLSVIPITMPSLREIRSDVEEIAQVLVTRLAKGQVVPSLSASAIDALRAYDFPGNVRELENILERALALRANPNLITVDDLQLTPSSATAVDLLEPLAVESAEESRKVVDVNGLPQRNDKPLPDYLDQIEKQVLTETLALCNGNRTQAARRLGITFRSIRYRLERLGLDPDGSTA